MMRVQVTFVADDDMITDAIAALYAMGKNPTKSSVKALLRSWYETQGQSAEAETVEERIFPEDISIEDDHWHATFLSPLRAELCGKW